MEVAVEEAVAGPSHARSRHQTPVGVRGGFCHVAVCHVSPGQTLCLLIIINLGSNGREATASSARATRHRGGVFWQIEGELEKRDVFSQIEGELDKRDKCQDIWLTWRNKRKEFSYVHEQQRESGRFDALSSGWLRFDVDTVHRLLEGDVESRHVAYMKSTRDSLPCFKNMLLLLIFWANILRAATVYTWISIWHQNVVIIFS